MSAPLTEEQPKEEKPLWRNPWVIAAVAAMLTMPLLRPFLRHVPKPPPVMGQLPAFQLTDQDGKPFGLKQMKGEVYVVNFFFTRCPTICPALTRAMKSLQDRFQKHKLPVKLLSITVDPGFDTPIVMKKYAQKWGADTSRWTFVTGPMPAIRSLAIKGFRTAISRPKKVASFEEITHTSKLILVDSKGQIRGRPDEKGQPLGYFGTSKLGLDELFHRSQHTLWEKFHK
jgi:protein SCO1/2